LVYDTIEPYNFVNNYSDILEEMLIDIQHFYDAIIINEHPIIRNYRELINSKEYFKINIIQDDILQGSECVGYIKTFWLKLIQRKWKKIFKERRKKIKMLSNPLRLMKRETTGK
jgi:hypothetical protein